MTRWLLSLLLFVGSAWAACPDCEDSTKFQVITVDATEIYAQPEFFIIKLSDMDPAWQEALADSGDTTGASIRVTLDDASTEVAIFPVGVAVVGDAVTGTLVVEAGSVSASVDVDYHIYTGMVGATMRAATDTYGRNAVFAGYAGAYMPGMFLADLTGAGRDLTAVNSPGTAASSLEGVLAATYVRASSQYHGHDGTPGVTGPPFTLEVIAESTDITVNQMLFGFARANTNNNDQGYVEFRGGQGGDPVRTHFQGNGSGLSNAITSTGFSANTPHYVATTRDAASGTSWVFIDGGSAGSDTTTLTAYSAPNRTGIGVKYDLTPDSYLGGNVTIALISASGHSADYVATMDTVFDAGVYTTGALVDVGGGNTPLPLLLISEE